MMEIAHDPAVLRPTGPIPAGAAPAGDVAAPSALTGASGRSFALAFVRLGAAPAVPALDGGGLPGQGVSPGPALDPSAGEVAMPPPTPDFAAGATAPAPAASPMVVSQLGFSGRLPASAPATSSLPRDAAPAVPGPDAAVVPVLPAAVPSPAARGPTLEEDVPPPEEPEAAPLPAVAGGLVPAGHLAAVPDRASAGTALPRAREPAMSAPAPEGRAGGAAPPAPGPGAGQREAVETAPPAPPPLAPARAGAGPDTLPERSGAELPRFLALGGPALSAAAGAPLPGPFPPLSGPGVEVPAVIRQIVHSAEGRRSAVFEIALSPPELGRVRMQLAPTEAGLVVTILAERGETADLLRRHGDDLLRDLRSAGHGNVTLDVATSGGDGAGGRSNRGTPIRSWPDAAAALPESLSNPATRVSVVELGARPGLDLRL